VRPVFYFDLGSPYAYLAAERIGGLFAEPPLWQPILLGGLFKRLGTGSWALGEARATNRAEIERRARAYGLPPVAWPTPFPGNTLFAMRAATHALQAGAVEAFALTAFREAFASGRDLSLPEDVRARAESSAVSLLVGSTIYFGDDRLDEAAAAAKRHGRARS